MDASPYHPILLRSTSHIGHFHGRQAQDSRFKEIYSLEVGIPMSLKILLLPIWKVIQWIDHVKRIKTVFISNESVKRFEFDSHLKVPY